MTSSVLLLLTLRVAGIVFLVAVASLLRRRAAASERHWLWMIALGGVLVLPFATAILPAWRVVPLSAGVSERSSTAAPTLAGEARVIVTTSADRAFVRGSPRVPEAQRGDAGVGSVDLRNLDLMRVALALWLAGTLVYLVRLLRAHARARAIVRASRPWINATCGGREFAIQQSDLATAPFTYGVFRPTIIVPADAVEWAAARVDAVVKHEAAHASREDGVALLLAELACAIYWWHPAVRYAGRQAAVECERACDDVVLETGMLASDYGMQLLAQAQAGSAWGTRPLATIMFGRSEGLAARIGALLDPRVDRRPLRRSRALSAAVIGVGTVALLAAAAPLEQSVMTPAPPTVPTTEAVPSAPSVPSVPSVAVRPAQAATPPAPPVRVLPAVHTSMAAPPGSGERPATACIQADAHQARTAHFDSLAFTGAGSFNTTSLGEEAASGSGTPRRYGTVLVWTGIDCIAWIRYADPIVVDRTWPGIKVQPGGEFVVHDESGLIRRDYFVHTGGTSSFVANGQRVAMTPNDVTWLADMVREYVRRRGVGATARADSIVVNGGAQALLAEVGQIGQGQVRVTYLLTGFGKVPTESRSAFIHDGAALLDHASARGQFLLAVPAAWKADERVLSALYAEAAVIEPDDIVEQLLRQTPPPRPLSPALRPLIVNLIATLQSVERRRALSAYYLDVRP